MHFISQDLEDYIEQHSEKEPALLAALNKETPSGARLQRVPTYLHELNKAFATRLS